MAEQTVCTTRLPAATREPEIQVMRGIACLLLVVFHVVGGEPTTALHVPDSSPVRAALDFFLYIRMPLFGFISGYVYALRPVRPENAGGFALKKLRRLGLPLICVSTLAFIADMGLHHGRLSEIWRIYLFSYGAFWFLQAMLLLFLAVVVLERFGVLDRLRTVALLGIVLFALTAPLEDIRFLSITGVVYLGPYFLAGLAVRRFSLHEDARLRTAAAVFLGLMLVFHAVRLATLPHAVAVNVNSSLSLLIGVSASYVLLTRPFRSSILARIGESSYAIYLFHIFFAVGVREVISEPLGLPLAGSIALGWAAGLLGPMVLETILSRNAVTRPLLLGLPSKPRRPEGKVTGRPA